MVDCQLEIAAATDRGAERPDNEDACGTLQERPDLAVLAVADGVSSYPGGEVASAMAVGVLLRTYREEPPGSDPGLRLYRAFQQANIEIHDRAIAVPELRGMATTLTSVVVDGGEMTAVHVGDSRLYLLRAGTLTQLTKDHTVAAGLARVGLLDPERVRDHRDRSVLTRSMGRELIVSRDRITQRLRQGDRLLLCSDGLHGVLADGEMAGLLAEGGAAGACRALLQAANARGTPDNLTAAVLQVVGPTPPRAERGGLAAAFGRLMGR